MSAINTHQNNGLSFMDKFLLESLLKFFNEPYNFNILHRYRSAKKGKTNISVSLLDWFIVNYAKKNGIQYEIKKYGRRKTILVEQSYTAALYAHKKLYFDPFARGSKQGQDLIIYNDQGVEISTAIRQMNFFRWAISNGVIEYIDKHVDEIYKDMNKRSNRGRRKPSNHKKKQLSVSACKSLGIHSVKMTVKFE
uniref:Uncharacterized protein n=1 Tax=viral metagenome TaxID=1070528 RepID=A0A6C0J4V1_9ZZZZ